MYKSTLFMGFAALASAANSTVNLWLVGFDQQDVLASVIGSDSTATTYSLNCGSSNADECGVPTSFTFTQGPSTLHYSYVAADTDNTQSINLGCVVTDSISGVCSVTMSGVVSDISASAFSTATTTAFSGTSDLGVMAVTITAGNVGSAATTATKTISSSGKSSSISSSTSASGTSASGAANSAASSQSTSTNGGMPMVTQAPWIFGGAAVAMAYAAM